MRTLIRQRRVHNAQRASTQEKGARFVRSVLQALQTPTVILPLRVQAAPAVSMLHRAPRPVLTVQLVQLTWTPVLRLPALLALPESTHLPDRHLAHSVLQALQTPTVILPLHVQAAPAVSMLHRACLLYTSPSPRDGLLSRMPSSA